MHHFPHWTHAAFFSSGSYLTTIHSIFQLGHIINYKHLIRVGKEAKLLKHQSPTRPLLEWMDELLIIEYIKFSLGSYSVSSEQTTA